MTGRVRLFSALYLLAAATNAVAAAPPDIVRECIDHVAADVRGITSLETACPGVRAALDSINRKASYSNGWEEQITRMCSRICST